MSNTYYTSLSGMIASSYGLQNTSNNIANMQSPGFKRNDVFYSSLGNGLGDEGVGHGVYANSTTINFSEGRYLQTTNASNLAVVGQGFFIIKLKNNQLLYTRNGEFEFKNGVLTDKDSKGQVMGFDKGGNLVPIHEKGPKESPGKASRDIFLKGIFVPHEVSKTSEPSPLPNTDDSSNEKKYENIIFELSNIYDKQGKAHTVQFELVNKVDHEQIPNKINYWSIEQISCQDAEINFSNFQQIVFSDFGGAQEGNNTLQFSLDGNQPITLYFGSMHDGSDKSVEIHTLNADTEKTQIEIYHNDGYALGTQMAFLFDENGQLFYQYDNKQIIEGFYIALARFDNLHDLEQTQNNVFRAKNTKGMHLGRAGKKGFGLIQSNAIETSNVDSTTEFANIVILQRMFQACSQVMDIEKKLLEELQTK